MCGLLLSIHGISDRPATAPPLPNDDLVLTAVAARGPDWLHVHRHHVTLPSGRTLLIQLAASVLGLRGKGVTQQPIIGHRGVLGWNGQVFRGIPLSVTDNDTVKVAERLQAGERLLDILASVEGPYAAIYLNTEAQTIEFQLDPLSRRSLLISTETASTRNFTLCSARHSAQDGPLAPMKALDGGAGGIIHLDKICVSEDGLLDLSKALVPRQLSDDSESEWTRVTPINPSIPSDMTELESPRSQVDSFISHLTESIRLRIENIPPSTDSSARLAILFSGGVDCTLLAALSHRCLPSGEPIDLVNVAFQRAPAKTSAAEDDYKVPDRISGLEAVEELRASCPGREWRFVKVNVEYEECLAHRNRVLDLMYPSSTEMDLSLAFPLYFASRGVGTVQSRPGGPETPYTVKAKVYFSGLGADEQLAGYARHRHAFQKGSWQGLVSELQLDMGRLPTRNLSRDDRIISSHARDARFPYLDLSFIAYLSSLPVWLKCDPTIDGGDKLLLRLAAKGCGLPVTSQRVKRAMQFGTRSSKVGGAGKGAKKGDLTVIGLDHC